MADRKVGTRWARGRDPGRAATAAHTFPGFFGRPGCPENRPDAGSSPGAACARDTRHSPKLQPLLAPLSLPAQAVIKNADMSEDMQQDAVDCATQAIEKFNIEKDIAAFIKKEFDKKYNPTWHCIVGRNFGSYVTHETKHFIYFYLGQVAILLFKSAERPAGLTVGGWAWCAEAHAVALRVDYSPSQVVGQARGRSS
eukprot:CAMPEP_0185156576 /NCGR_PEP_ID=MMETSP1139-20130426/1202_1 /TAXON_ID=298111 /ORGANISM="Pavlova sp., Strain CCMP459" /LENGTH=196 /DNA_ID=CAMNT_0027721581 /DNA_START=15 /DNA_END=607 /DNA_ORIENTATION=-